MEKDKHIKHLAVRFTLLFFLAILPQLASAYDFMVDGLCYYINGDGNTVTVTYQNSTHPRYPNLSGAVTIPASVTYNGQTYSVTTIGSNTFSGCTGLTSVTIPNSVTAIGNYAFRSCAGLKSVTIGNSVTAIGGNAFQNCTGLTAVTWNAKSCVDFSSYYSAPFNDIRANIKTFTFGDEIKRIPAHLCYGMSKLTSVTIPNSVTTIGDFSFKSCSGLTSLSIGNSVTSIGKQAFQNCTGLTSVTIPNSVTAIGNNAFVGCSGLTSVTIPNSVTTIGDGVFKSCSGLTSLSIGNSVTAIGKQAFEYCTRLTEVYCCAFEPPTLGTNCFQDVNSEIPVYVPTVSIETYMENPSWSGYFSNFLPLGNNQRLTVNLPTSATGGKYKDMYIDAKNAATGRNTRCLVTDKMSYNFSVPGNATYDITLENSMGTHFGEIKDVHVGSDDVEVTFPSLLTPQTVAVAVTMPGGIDVTDKVSITWCDGEDNFLVQGSSISGLASGMELKYEINLPQDLAMLYEQPAVAEYTVKEGDNGFIVNLQPFGKSTLGGTVCDKVTGKPINKANITVSQTLNGKHSVSFTATSDKDGNFSVETYKAPSKVTIGAKDYVSHTQDITIDSPTVSLGTVQLDEIDGAVINTSFTYQASVKQGETPTVQNFFEDYNNVSYSIFNNTQQKDITQFSAQYPEIVLLEDVNDGDQLTVTASSIKCEFNDVQASYVVNNKSASVTLPIVEHGAIEATYNDSQADVVVGMLFNSNGEQVMRDDYYNKQLTLTNIADGNYTLISMQANDYMNSVLTLSSLAATGLKANDDYISSTVSVNSGTISELQIANVPALDVDQLYYTSNSTYFNANKASVTIGNYVTLTANIDFKKAYQDQMSDISLIFDLPQGCEFVDNSVVMGNTIHSYSVNNQQIIVSDPVCGENVKFCVRPTAGGNFSPSAFVQFNIDGTTVTQPIGTANYTAKELSINVPPTAAETTIPISGTANGQCSVEVYDNDVLIGQTTSLANGTWAMTCELNDAFDMSSHSIYAKVTTASGLNLMTENRTCVYDKNAIIISSVTMINTAHSSSSLYLCQYTTVFDFLNPTSTLPAYWYWPSYPDFTFLVDFNNNDTTLISEVVLDVHCSNNTIVSLSPQYDKDTDKYIVAHKFPSYALPKTVGVNFSYLNLHMVDSAAIMAHMRKYYDLIRICDITDENDVISYSVMPRDESLALSCAYIRTPLSRKTHIYNNISALSFEQLEFENESFKYYYDNESGTLVLKETGDSIFVFASYSRSDSTAFLNFVSAMRGAPTVSMKSIGQKASGLDYFSDHIELNKNEKFWSGTLAKAAVDEANRKLPCATEEQRYYIHHAVHRLLNSAAARKLSATAYSAGYAILTAGNNSPEAAVNFIDMASSAKSNTFAQGMKELSNAVQVNLKTIHDARSCNPPSGATPYPGHSPYVQDPSGFVYEGVESNRLQGVTATIYYKETVEDLWGEQYEQEVMWDAEEYAQKNPLFTDENGMYQWDVPQGLWQVRFSKNGYEPTQSEWLPVPPPQLDVNIGMTQLRQPEVAMVHAYKNGVELTFDKYMRIETLTTDNISVTQDGNNVTGTIELVNEEQGDNEKLASKVRFVPASEFTAESVTLTVKNNVESYAGIRMNSDFTQSFDIEEQIYVIGIDSLVNVGYGESRQVLVEALPVDVARGKTLNVRSNQPIIAEVDQETNTLDKHGRANITVNGNLPGATSLTLNVEGFDLKRNATVQVVDVSSRVTEKPIASVNNGMVFDDQITVELSCNTPGAVIYYTTDGTCPCDEEERILYDGPITISSNTTLKAIAIAPGYYESDIATYYYFQSSAIDEISCDAPFKVTPTMVHDGFVVKGNFEDCDVRLYSINGRELLHNARVLSDEFVSLSNLNSGIYIAVITVYGRPYPVRIIKI